MQPRMAAGKDGCHEAGVGVERQVPDGVDAAMRSVQPPSRDAAADAARRQPELNELAERDHPVLAPRALRQRAIKGMLRLASPLGTYPARPLHDD